jgi:hypothetical protein
VGEVFCDERFLGRWICGLRFFWSHCFGLSCLFWPFVLMIGETHVKGGKGRIRSCPEQGTQQGKGRIVCMRSFGRGH